MLIYAPIIVPNCNTLAINNKAIKLKYMRVWVIEATTLCVTVILQSMISATFFCINVTSITR